MKALVKYAPGFENIEIREVNEPIIDSDQVLVEIKAAGICGSDVKHYEDGSNLAIPVILGHELSGKIIQVGDKVKHYHEGDRVVSETSAYTCGVCDYCLTGDYHLCPERKGLGSKIDGAFTKYIALPWKIIHKLPDQMSYDEAALVQPCADICNAVIRKADIKPGDSVVVLGPGPMGLLTTQVAKANGAGTVIQTGHKGVRLSIASKIGADKTIMVEEEDPIEKVLEYTDNKGADVVFETSGSPEALIQSLDMTKRNGQIILIASPRVPVEAHFGKILGKPLSLKGSIMSKWIDYDRAIRLMSLRMVKADKLITHRLDLTDWRKAFDFIRVKKVAGKVILYPT
ncbi:MAG: zinc-binding dehydrogenase [Candidatus Bathyarchaeota archaeon]